MSYTPDGYRALLRAALEAGYAFRGFAEHVSRDAERVLLLRHDVDADPGAALDLARIEHDEEVSATYFFMTRSPLYNVFARQTTRIVEQILRLGHQLGLHHDVAFEPDVSRSREAWIELEARTLGEWFDATVGSVSFHQPSFAGDLGGLRLRGLVSAYDLPGFRYVSDANRELAADGAEEVFRSAAEPRIQLLVHPMWWVSDDPDASSEALWDRALRAAFERAQEQLLATERAYGSPRSFRIERQ